MTGNSRQPTGPKSRWKADRGVFGVFPQAGSPGYETGWKPILFGTRVVVVGWAVASPRCGGLRRTSRALAHQNAATVWHSAHRTHQDRMRMFEKPCRILVGRGSVPSGATRAMRSPWPTLQFVCRTGLAGSLSHRTDLRGLPVGRTFSLARWLAFQANIPALREIAGRAKSATCARRSVRNIHVLFG